MVKRVKYILDSYGLSYMWYQQQELSTKQCKVIIHQRIEDIALQKWNTDISTSSMCKMYRIYIFLNLILKTICYIQITEIEFHYQN